MSCWQVANQAKHEQPRRIFGRDITNLPINHKGSNISHINKGSNISHINKDSSIVNINKGSNNNIFKVEKVDSVKLEKVDSEASSYETQILQTLVAASQRQPEQVQGTEISGRMRQILIDWLVDVQESFGLKEQTLHLSLAYLSQGESLMRLSKENYQLFGITCLWIASKYEEIYPPRMRCFVDVTANTYSICELKHMESRVLEALSFGLVRTTTLSLLNTIVNSDQQHRSLCKYLLQLACFDGRICKAYSPTVVVLSAVAVSDSVYHCKSNINKLLQHYPSGIDMLQQYPSSIDMLQQYPSSIDILQQYPSSIDILQQCYKQLCQLLTRSSKAELTAIKRKYQKEKHHRVGKLKIELK